jgi:hypothetical protein
LTVNKAGSLAPDNGTPLIPAKYTLRGQLRAVFQLRVSLTFIVGYIVVNILFAETLRSVIGNKALLDLALLLSSPFNFLENFSNLYPSSSVGLLLNFALTGYMLILVEGYCRLGQVKLRGRVSVDFAFLASIIASYAVSVFTLLTGGTPSYGSSIVGFCMMVFLLVNTLLDSPIYLSKEARTSRSVWARLAWLPSLAFSLVLIPGGYIFGNPGLPLHLEGLVVFALLVAYHSRRGKS